MVGQSGLNNAYYQHAMHDTTDPVALMFCFKIETQNTVACYSSRNYLPSTKVSQCMIVSAIRCLRNSPGLL